MTTLVAKLSSALLRRKSERAATKQELIEQIVSGELSDDEAAELLEQHGLTPDDVEAHIVLREQRESLRAQVAAGEAAKATFAKTQQAMQKINAVLEAAKAQAARELAPHHAAMPEINRVIDLGQAAQFKLDALPCLDPSLDGEQDSLNQRRQKVGQQMRDFQQQLAAADTVGSRALLKAAEESLLFAQRSGDGVEAAQREVERQRGANAPLESALAQLQARMADLDREAADLAARKSAA